jgi:hypothetical protein
MPMIAAGASGDCLMVAMEAKDRDDGSGKQNTEFFYLGIIRIIGTELLNEGRLGEKK